MKNEKSPAPQFRLVGRAARARRVSHSRSLLAAFLLSFIIYHLSFPLRAQPPPQTENRFLFILNTSSAMRPMSNGLQQAVLGLLQSRMQGQMRDGDTFGFWTYDDRLHADFPMQVWSNKNQGAILQAVSGYLAEARYGKPPHLEKVLPAARRLIQESRVITLLFVFDGSETMRGTGFDKDINDLHKESGRQMRADNIPFVTVLAARNGKVFDYRVRTPASVSLPQTAGFFKPAETNAVPAVAAATPPPPAVVPPKPPEPRHLEIVLRPTPLPNTNPPPVALAATPEPAAPRKPEPVIPPAPPPVESAPAEPAKVPVATPAADLSNPHSPNPNLNPNPVIAPEPPPPAVAPMGRAGSPLPAAPPGNPPPPINHTEAAPVVPPPTPPLEATPEPSPAPPANPSNPPSSAKAAEGRQSPLSSVALAKEEIRPAAHPAPLAAPAAVVLPSPRDHVALLVIAFSMVTIAAVMVLILIRRSRTPPSLISRSLRSSPVEKFRFLDYGAGSCGSSPACRRVYFTFLGSPLNLAPNLNLNLPGYGLGARLR